MEIWGGFMRRNIEQTSASDEGRTDTASGRREAKRRQLHVFLVALAAIAVVAIVGAFLFQIYVAPFRRPVMTVDDAVIRMGYFLKRAELAGSPTGALQAMATEEVIKLAATEFGLEVTELEIERAMRSVATNSPIDVFTPEAAAMTESDFREWYAGELETTGLSNAEYRDMIKTRLLAAYIQEALGQNIPAQGEQVNLGVIVLGTSADADRAKARLNSGESFAEVAAGMSLDAQTRESGGAVGWVPRGVLPYDDVIFALEAGQVSEPTPTDSEDPSNSQFLLFMVSEKAADRVIDEAAMQTLKANVFNLWLTEEMSKRTIEYLLDESDQAWVEFQLARRAGS
jgi:foldase protein PrsA